MSLVVRFLCCAEGRVRGTESSEEIVQKSIKLVYQPDLQSEPRTQGNDVTAEAKLGQEGGACSRRRFSYVVFFQYASNYTFKQCCH